MNIEICLSQAKFDQLLYYSVYLRTVKSNLHSRDTQKAVHSHTCDTLNTKINS